MQSNQSFQRCITGSGICNSTRARLGFSCRRYAYRYRRYSCSWIYHCISSVSIYRLTSTDIHYNCIVYVPGHLLSCYSYSGKLRRQSPVSFVSSDFTTLSFYTHIFIPFCDYILKNSLSQGFVKLILIIVLIFKI